MTTPGLTIAVPRGALFSETLTLLDAVGIDTAEVRAFAPDWAGRVDDHHLMTLDAELRATHGTAAATEPIDTPIGPIEPGTVAAQRFRWEGPVDGGAVIPARS